MNCEAGDEKLCTALEGCESGNAADLPYLQQVLGQHGRPGGCVRGCEEPAACKHTFEFCGERDVSTLSCKIPVADQVTRKLLNGRWPNYS